jgi:cyclase
MRNIRIIPRLDIKGQNLIKGVHLECLRVVGDPKEFARRYYQEGADELIYMDIVASLFGRNNLVDIVEAVSRHVFIPLTVGGGVRSLADINRLLRAGADKVAMNSQIIKTPDLVNRAVRSFGSQCIVGSIEAKRIANGKWEARFDNGREPSGRDAVDWALEIVDRGIGELLVTSIDREGTELGYDEELIREISSRVSVPVIASGGAGKLEDIEKVIYQGKADAVAVASILHFNKTTVKEIKKYLQLSVVRSSQ